MLARLVIVVLLLTSAAGPACAVGDPRFAMSGWAGWSKFDEVGSTWWLNWGHSTSTTYVNDNYPYLRMYWRTKAGEYTDAQIQGWASTVRALYGPGVTVWWTASNEPNDRGQANQTPAEFAAGYYQYHKNLRIGDPTCKILGPGILNWTFQSDSVWQKGREWYQEFRTLWAADPVYSAYSMSVQGNPYPPMDGFNLHTYDLRGIQGTPYVGPPDWNYLASETLACRADLLTWPETQNLKIWNTEYGSLRAGTITDSADTLGGFCLWLRQQPFMERWFFFILRTTDGSWQQTVLLDASGNINALGKAHYTLSTMGDAEVLNLPFNAGYGTGSAYTRPGTVYRSGGILEDHSLGLQLGLKQGTSFSVGDMRGRTYTTDRRIRRVTLNYRFTCDPALFQFEVDIPGHERVFASGAAAMEQWLDLDLSAYDTNQVSLGLYCVAANTCQEADWVRKLQINNITFWFDDTLDASFAQAKSLPERRRVRLSSAVVSAVYPDCFAVQAEDRSAGIVAIGSTTAQVGDRCTLAGDTLSSDAMRVLVNPEVADVTQGAPPKPMAMNCAATGGGASGLQQAVVDDAAASKYASGLSNVGLLVRTAGIVSYVDPSERFFYLDDGSGLNDGSGHAGIRVSLQGLPVPVLGTPASVTGVCFATLIDGRPARLLRPRGPDDAQFGAVTSRLTNGGFERGDISGWQVIGNHGAAVSGIWYFNISAYSGDWFYGHGTSYGALPGTLYQRVQVDPAKRYDARAWSRVLHGGNNQDSAMNRIGVDPTGGVDPASPAVIWSPWDSQSQWYASVWRELALNGIQPAGDYITLFLETLQQYEPGWHLNCFDTVTLTELE